MEIFGIPVFIIFCFIMLVWSNYSEQQQKEKKEIAEKWNPTTIGMSADAVTRILGKPHRVWRAGAAEIWGYGPSDSNGQVKFIDGKVIAFQKPD